LERLPEEETESLVAKLESMSFRVIYARGMCSVLEEAFSLLAAARWHLKRAGGASDPWRRDAAFHMYQFAEALRQAADAAMDIEKQTGYSGRELAEE
jgi:hypothetical protein